MNLAQIKETDSITDDFEDIEEIGKGAYGVVKKCRCKQTQEIVAVKEIKKFIDKKQDTNEDKKKLIHDDLPNNILREIKILNTIKHENIVNLRAVYNCRGIVYLIFDYYEFDVLSIIRNEDRLSLKFIKSIMKQLLMALSFFNKKRILHRDLKPANMLLTRKNVLKICDFGLARESFDQERYSYHVITEWYRPPELFLRSDSYGPEVDIWSSGCIFYELLTKSVLFYNKDDRANSDLNFLENVLFEKLGYPDDSWPGFYERYGEIFKVDEKKMRKRPKYNFRQYLINKISEYRKDLTTDDVSSAVDMICSMVVLNPSRRKSADELLESKFFTDDWSDTDPVGLPELKIGDLHFADIEKQRLKNKKTEQQAKDAQ